MEAGSPSSRLPTGLVETRNGGAAHTTGWLGLLGAAVAATATAAAACRHGPEAPRSRLVETFAADPEDGTTMSLLEGSAMSEGMATVP
ncbi:hypothetical protein OG753_06500 [Streptomyces sp. NBC_00029]|uniref:hypothetical protein n=1 Tax=Streptomyces sp. NBC_00029 TaxID=2903613 RepID=UPI00324D3E2B